MENPGLLMIILNNEDIKEITVEDPTRKLKTMELTVGKKIELKNENAVLNWNASQGKTKITAGLPEGLYAGESVIIR